MTEKHYTGDDLAAAYKDGYVKGSLNAALASSTPANIDVDALAQEIRRVDGSHNLGAGALAEALLPFIATSTQPSAVEPTQPEMPMQVPDPRVFGQVNLADRTIFVRHAATPLPVARVEPTAEPMKAVQITIEALRRAAKEIRDADIQGWGNTCDDAAYLLEQLSTPPPVAGDVQKAVICNGCEAIYWIETSCDCDSAKGFREVLITDAPSKQEDV